MMWASAAVGLTEVPALALVSVLSGGGGGGVSGRGEDALLTSLAPLAELKFESGVDTKLLPA